MLATGVLRPLQSMAIEEPCDLGIKTCGGIIVEINHRDIADRGQARQEDSLGGRMGLGFTHYTVCRECGCAIDVDGKPMHLGDSGVIRCGQRLKHDFRVGVVVGFLSFATSFLRYFVTKRKL